MSSRPTESVGSALVWKGVQLVGGKGISLARFLILARLLAPEDFGLLAIAMVSVELAMAATTIGVTEALVQREDPERRHYDSAWTLGLVRAGLVAMVMLVAAPWIAGLFGEPRAAPLLQVLGLRPLVDAVASIKLVDLTRSLRFQPSAVIKVSEAVINTLGSILLVLFLPPLLVDATVSVALAGSLGVWAVVTGTFAGSISTVALSYIMAPYRPRLHLDRSAVRGLLGFGKWLLVSSLLGASGHAVLRAAISHQLGAAELGLFYLALRLTVLPNDLAGEVIRSVAFPIFARAQDDRERAREAFRASLTAMLAILMPVYAAFIALAPSVAEHVLGSQWWGLVPVIQILALDGIVDVLADATRPLLLGLGQPRRRAALRVIRVTVVIGLAWPLTAMLGIVGAALAWLAAESVQFVAAYTMASRALDRPFSGLGRTVAALTTTSAAAGCVAWIVDGLLPGVFGLGAAAAAALLTSGPLLVVLDRRYQLGLVSDFISVFPALASRLSLASETR